MIFASSGIPRDGIELWNTLRDPQKTSEHADFGWDSKLLEVFLPGRP